MIAGQIKLEDTVLNFKLNYESMLMEYSVTDTVTGETEHLQAPQDEFFETLAKFFNDLTIAAHNYGEPDYRIDYPDAEETQGNIR